MKVKVNRKWKWKESESEISLLTLIYQESLTSESGEGESESGPWLEEAATFIAMEAAPNTMVPHHPSLGFILSICSLSLLSRSSNFANNCSLAHTWNLHSRRKCLTVSDLPHLHFDVSFWPIVSYYAFHLNLNLCSLRNLNNTCDI
jgi:hypothetical protein